MLDIIDEYCRILDKMDRKLKLFYSLTNNKLITISFFFIPFFILSI